MNSVGGIQVFAALKACGSVLKTVPDFDALYEDEFYPIVKYYLASNSSSEENVLPILSRSPSFSSCHHVYCVVVESTYTNSSSIQIGLGSWLPKKIVLSGCFKR